MAQLMIFDNDKPIYLQMAERLGDDILTGVYGPDDRVPSIREYAVLLQVNINTAMKAYEELSRADILYNKRGLGYFVKRGAREKILEDRRRHFIQSILPGLFRNMQLLDIGIDEINRLWTVHVQAGDNPGTPPAASH